MAEIIVTSTADSGAGSLRQAIADAQDGDVILFDSDVFPVGETTTILLSSQLAINKSISIYGGEADGNGGYTTGATLTQYVYRTVNGVRTKVTLGENDLPLPSETVYFNVFCRVALNGQGSTRCMITGSSSTATPVCTIAGIRFVSGTSSNSYAGGLYANNASDNTLRYCAFDSCSASSNGGALFTNFSAQNALYFCSFSNCSSGGNGGAISAGSSTQNEFLACSIDDCSATGNASAAYFYGSSQNGLTFCSVNGSVYAIGSSRLESDGSDIAELSITSASATLALSTVTRIATATIGAVSVSFDDSAALSLTGTATVGAATFSAATGEKGFLATATGIDLTSATLTNVVQCAYGAGITEFEAGIAVDQASLEWTQTDSTKTVLLEADDGTGWTTLAQSSSGSYSFTTASPTTYRFLAFDGDAFYVKTVTRTYYYVGGSSGSFTEKNDWSLTSGGAAISAAPTVKDCKFIIE